MVLAAREVILAAMAQPPTLMVPAAVQPLFVGIVGAVRRAAAMLAVPEEQEALGARLITAVRGDQQHSEMEMAVAAVLEVRTGLALRVGATAVATVVVVEEATEAERPDRATRSIMAEPAAATRQVLVVVPAGRAEYPGAPVVQAEAEAEDTEPASDQAAARATAVTAPNGTPHTALAAAVAAMGTKPLY